MVKRGHGERRAIYMIVPSVYRFCHLAWIGRRPGTINDIVGHAVLGRRRRIVRGTMSMRTRSHSLSRIACRLIFSSSVFIGIFLIEGFGRGMTEFEVIASGGNWCCGGEFS
jgi:hypothetical protein